jgi:membrane associated rhomboid family serine protease
MLKPPPVSQAMSTWITSAICCAATAVTIATWTGHQDIAVFATNEKTFGSQPWRLLSSALPHLSFLHLAFNVYWLWVMGGLMESKLGSARFAGFACFATVVSSAFDHAFSMGGVGLSGLGYALFGTLWALNRASPSWAGCMDTPTTQLFVAWFFICIATTLTGIFPVANVAHGAGVVIGAVIGFSIAAQGSRRVQWAMLSIFLFATSIALPIFALRTINPRSAAISTAIHGWTAMQSGDYTKAESLLRESAMLDPREATTWVNLGSACMELQRWEESYNAYARARDLLVTVPNDVAQAMSYAAWQVAYERQVAQQNEDAVLWMRRRVEANPTDAHAGLSGALASTEDFAGARKALAEASRIDPTNTEVKHMTEYLASIGQSESN